MLARAVLLLHWSIFQPAMPSVFACFKLLQCSLNESTVHTWIFPRRKQWGSSMGGEKRTFRSVCMLKGRLTVVFINNGVVAFSITGCFLGRCLHIHLYTCILLVLKCTSSDLFWTFLVREENKRLHTAKPFSE